jgi:hypothetical protein
LEAANESTAVNVTRTSMFAIALILENNARLFNRVIGKIMHIAKARYTI